jgi:hypothetical protein
LTLALADGLDRHLAPVPLAVDVALACLGVWLRRSRPVGFAVTAILFGLFSAAAGGVALIALFTVAVHRRPAVTGLVTAGAALSCAGTVFAGPGTVGQAALGAICVAAIAAGGMLVRARRRA